MDNFRKKKKTLTTELNIFLSKNVFRRKILKRAKKLNTEDIKELRQTFFQNSNVNFMTTTQRTSKTRKLIVEYNKIFARNRLDVRVMTE